MRHDYVILDLETARSSEDCRHCGCEILMHTPLTGQCLLNNLDTTFVKLGWTNKPLLGLSVGCYWDSIDKRIHWFDEDTLEATMRLFVERQPLLVSFNGISFDFPLMRGILRRRAENLPPDDGYALMQLCDTFKILCASSYDVLSEVWKIDPVSKFEKGINSLDSIAQENGLGGKLGSGEQAPRDWAEGRWATVLNYCAYDVYLTKDLFELVWMGMPLKRRGGKDVLLPIPVFPGEAVAHA